MPLLPLLVQEVTQWGISSLLRIGRGFGGFSRDLFTPNSHPVFNLEIGGNITATVNASPEVRLEKLNAALANGSITLDEVFDINPELVPFWGQGGGGGDLTPEEFYNYLKARFESAQSRESVEPNFSAEVSSEVQTELAPL